ncbi:FAD-binding oxidoreductase [Babesia caballi]|uniref:FAD-binding oxidoreductase n=1 Tax=Babesia caballi TaxID=5871 RepID=A0AAV4LQF6_BABCB|nr:FAD-binding oxidoreductase [Babesia caballi]
MRVNPDHVFDNYQRVGLDNTDLVGDIESVLVGRQFHVGLLETVGPVERVDAGALDVVELGNSLGDLGLVGARVDDEDEGVDFLHHLHGLLSCERVLDDGELVELLRESSAQVAPVLGSSGKGKGAAPEEVGVAPDFEALRSGRLLDAVGCDLGLLDLLSVGRLLGS